MQNLRNPQEASVLKIRQFREAFDADWQNTSCNFSLSPKVRANDSIQLKEKECQTERVVSVAISGVCNEPIRESNGISSQPPSQVSLESNGISSRDLALRLSTKQQKVVL